MPQQPQKSPVAPAAAVRVGDRVAYPVKVGGKEVLSRGEVFGFRRVGKNRAEITLLHTKTGSLFTNTVKGDSPVMFPDLGLEKGTSGLADLVIAHLQKVLGERMSEFYRVLPIED